MDDEPTVGHRRVDDRVRRGVDVDRFRVTLRKQNFGNSADLDLVKGSERMVLDGRRRSHGRGAARERQPGKGPGDEHGAEDQPGKGRAEHDRAERRLDAASRHFGFVRDVDSARVITYGIRNSVCETLLAPLPTRNGDARRHLSSIGVGEPDAISSLEESA